MFEVLRSSLRSWRVALAIGCSALMLAGCTRVFVEPAAHGDESRRTIQADRRYDGRVNADTVASLATIVNRELQNGHYAEGEKALQRYVHVHPDNQEAQMFLRQLTEDPKSALGATSSPHMVQSGDSYSTLAAQYLGDQNLFVVLARYNGSNNPSLIRAGSTIQIPVSRSAALDAATATQAKVSVSMVPAEASLLPVPMPARSAGVGAPIKLAANVSRSTPLTGSPEQRAEQLKIRSLELYRQGHEQQALAMLDQALLLNPQLTSRDPAFATLRQTWITNQHQQAMVLYLDQQPDQAIALWNRVLAVDPGYEPAVIYRLHALELQQHMKQY